MWPADKHVSLIYDGAVEWLLGVVNIRLVPFWRQLHRAGEEKGREDGEACFVEKRIFPFVHSLSLDSWFEFALENKLCPNACTERYSINIDSR